MKILIIRFSSIGDVLQSLSIAGALNEKFPQAEIHWVTRQDLVSVIESHPALRKVYALDPSKGFRGLLALAALLRAEKYTHVYDAHNNLRSRVLCWSLLGVLHWRRWLGRVAFLRRSVFRYKRFLLFRFRINTFRQPFSGQRDLLLSLKHWGVSEEPPPPPQLFLPVADISSVNSKLPVKEFVALAPSAAYPLKRWPLESWKDLIARLPHINFVILGGPQDTFLQELVLVDPSRVINLAGALSLIESSVVVEKSRCLVTNDTGVLHMAEQLGKTCIALMGPAPFGFPCRAKTRVLQLDLECRPCSKHGQGPCVNPQFQKCLRGISPEWVARELSHLLSPATM